MNRYKWYRLGLSIKIKQFMKDLQKTEFTDAVSCGYIPLNKTANGQEFRFLWKSNITKTNFDKDGEPVIELIPTINYCDMHLFEHNGNNWLRLNNPPRSTKELMNSMEDIAGFGFYAESLQFPSNHLPTTLSNLNEAKLIGFKALGAVVENKAIFRIEGASKEGLALEEINFLKKLAYSIDSMTYEIVFERIRGQVCLSSTGLIKISGQLSPMILEFIELDLIRQK